MKKLIILLISIFLLSAMAMQAQTFESNSAFKPLKVSSTGEKLLVGDLMFDIYKTSSGSLYVKGVGIKSQKEYPIWIHQETNMEFEGHTVYRTKNGKYSILKLNKAGYPYNKWIKLIE